MPDPDPPGPPDASPRGPPWRHRLSRWYAPYLGLLLAYWVAARIAGVRPAIGTSVSSVLGLRIIPDLCAAYLVGRLVLIVARRARTFRGLGRALREDLFRAETAERLAGIPLFVLGTVFTFDVYGAVKMAIPRLATYDWDAPLARLDFLLHGGRDPWTLTHALPGGDAVTHLLDQVYVSWFAVLIGSVLVVATWAPHRLRARFFLTVTASCALLGSLAATLLASGGPVYFGDFVAGGDRFLPLLEALGGTAARDGQLALWEAFATGSDKLYGGISAMPSMHVALTAAVALAAFAWHPVAGAVAALYAALILLGSVHLAWHYAIDGYVAIGLVAVLWIGAGRLVGREGEGRG